MVCLVLLTLLVHCKGRLAEFAPQVSCMLLECSLLCDKSLVLTEFLDFDTDPPRSIIYNTGLSTYNNNGERMILSEMVRVVGHELGHNWGSHHDPSTNECDGNFLMNEFAQDGSRASHMVCPPWP